MTTPRQLRPPDLIEVRPEKLIELRDLRQQVAEARRNAPRRFATPGALAKHCDPTVRQTPALDLIDQAVVDMLDGNVIRWLLNAPPQTGKSQRISRWTALWLLCCDPTLRIVIVSAEKELAVRWGRQIKRDLEAHPDLKLTLREDSQAAGRWETAEGGGLFCTGVAAGTTGRPIDVLIIDDPIKDRAQAESKAMQRRVWDFWENDAGQRSRKALIMATRWHVNDLHGQLLEKEPGRWASLSIPAIADADNDPLGRTVGVELQSANPELHPPGYYHERQKLVSPYVWSSLFQQHPTRAEGNIFKRDQWRYWEYDVTPDGRRWLHLHDEAYGRDDRFDLDDCSRFITIDLAASTRTSADYTVAAAWAITMAGDLVCLGRVRDRVSEIDHAAFIEPLRSKWLRRYDVTHIEKGMQTTTLVHALGQQGVPIAPLTADVDKLTRALPYAGLVRQGKVWLPAGAPWLDEWIDEHADFTGSGKEHDDQCDVGAYAARVAIAYWIPRQTAEEELARRSAPDPDYVDLMAANW